MFLINHLFLNNSAALATRDILETCAVRDPVERTIISFKLLAGLRETQCTDPVLGEGEIFLELTVGFPMK